MTIIIILLVIIVNMIFILKKYGKNHKRKLADLLKKMAMELNYEFEEDTTKKRSSFADNKLLLGSDIDFRYDINIQTRLFFEIFSYISDKPFYKYYINFTHYTSKAISIIFALWIYTIVFGVEVGMLGLSMIAIIIIVLLQIFLQIIGILFFKKHLKTSEIYSPTLQNNITYLYFYIPIIMLNGILEFIYPIKWLFSDNKK